MIIRETATNNILTKSNLPVCDYSANPYTGCEHACKYCYACFMKRFTKRTEEWGEFTDVKFWTPIKNAEKYRGKEIFIGSVTDPYQPAEEKYLRTRTLLEELKGSGAIISISTKSDLIVRDLDLIKSFDNATVSWSVNTLDENFRRDMDRGVSIERRLAAMKVFHDAKVKTTCFISPIFPEITNVKEIIERARGDCNLIWLENLNLRGTFKPVITEYIAASRPQLIPLYRDIYTKGNDCYWQALDGELQEWAKTKGLEYLTNEDVFDRPFDAPTVIVNFFYHSKIKKSAKNKPNITQ
ncbi:MAG: radical SAM protein [Clostridia bacterium]|nr:radical SAM protein [Clostridia bacterium]